MGHDQGVERCLACRNCSGIPSRNGGVGRRQWALNSSSSLDPGHSAAILPVGLSGVSQETMMGQGSSGKHKALWNIPVLGLRIFQGASRQLIVLRYGLPCHPRTVPKRVGKSSQNHFLSFLSGSTWS